MRWIDRGPEPDSVARYASQFTQGWIDYFRNRTSERPTDFLWSVFRPILSERSNGNCWYCERLCDAETGGRAPTVDHFRPVSRFPHLAYDWSNWIFSCRRCNVENKKDKWPESGYVDPCAKDAEEHPERYFDYDADTGEIVPRTGLSSVPLQRAYGTIDDLGINELDIMYFRLQWTRRFVTDLLSLPVTERRAFAEYIAEQSTDFLGTTLMVIEQLQLSGDL